MFTEAFRAHANESRELDSCKCVQLRVYVASLVTAGEARVFSKIRNEVLNVKEENCISVYRLIMIEASIVGVLGEQIQPGSRRKRQEKQEEK